LFERREHWLPTANSLATLDRYCAELVPLQAKPEHFRGYYQSHRSRFGFDLDYAHEFLAPGARVLEVGGMPFFLTVALMDSFAVTTVDKITKEYPPRLVEHYRIDTRHYDLDYDRIGLDDDSFDGIIMNEVFEHLRVNLIFTMREMLRLLRPGGVLMLSTPNLRSVQGLYNLIVRGEAHVLLGDLYESYAGLESIDMMGHVREYTPVEVTRFLRRVGFEIDGLIYRGDYSGSRVMNFAHYLTRLWPGGKPFFSVIARKPVAG
jgi:SAM-dependent methyltransferase